MGIFMFRKVRNFAQSLLSHGAVTVECWTKVNTQFVKLKPVTRQSIGVPAPHNRHVVGGFLDFLLKILNSWNQGKDFVQAVWNTCCRSVLVELSLGWIGFATFQGPAHALVMKSRWLKTKLLGAVLLRNCAGNKEHCARSGWSSAGNQSVEIIGSHQFPAL